MARFWLSFAALMGDENDQIDLVDRELALHYQDMMTFLKDEHKEVKILDNKYMIRGCTSAGRVRGLYSDIYKALKQYSDNTLAPGLLVQHVEQAKTKIQKMKTEPNKKTTMMTLLDDGFLDSDPTATVEFAAADLEPLKERCRRYWQTNGDLYRRWRAHLDNQYHYLSQAQITDAFLRSTKGEEVTEILRHTTPRGSAMNVIPSMEDSNDEDDDDDDEDYTPVIKDEDIASLRALLPSFTDDELRQALVQANGNVELAADALLRN